LVKEGVENVTAIMLTFTVRKVKIEEKLFSRTVQAIGQKLILLVNRQEGMCKSKPKNFLTDERRMTTAGSCPRWRRPIE
jgi:hypothetical protein